MGKNQIKRTSVLRRNGKTTRSLLKKNIVLITSCVLLLTGCSPQTTASSATFEEEKAHAEKYQPLVDDWKYYLKHDKLSSFERDVLGRAVKTGKIAQDDYEQAQAKYLQCMVSEGFDHLKFSKLPDGLYELAEDSDTLEGSDSSKNYENAMLKCSEGTTRIIEAEYRDQQDNPERYKDHGLIAVQCLRDAGKVDKSYTAAQFNKAATNYRKGTYVGTLSEQFGFPIHSSDKQTMFCLSLGGLSIGGDF